jgi:probable F420-dependent oxidoreductase
MKFGIFLCSQHHAGDPLEARIAEILEQAQLAEDLGYESLWVGDHHDLEDAYFAPLVTLGAIAARTRRVTLGTSILLLPLYHPVHLAEGVAMVDLISAGRMILGAGAGYRHKEFETFGVPRSERLARLTEGVALLRRLWTEPLVTHHGPYHHLKDVAVHLKPVRRPCPIWLGANSPAAVRAAATVGDGWLTDPTSSLDDLRKFGALYRETRRAAGRQGPENVAVMREAYLARDGAEARETMRPHLVEKYRKYSGWSFSPVVQAGTTYDDLLREERFIIGSPEECLPMLRRLEREIGAAQVIFRFQHVGMEHAKAMATIRLFAEAVMPEFRR